VIGFISEPSGIVRLGGYKGCRQQSSSCTEEEAFLRP